MKLNLVADYDVCGKKFCVTFAIHQSNNLVGLREMCSMNFPMRGGWKRIPPTSLTMCESRKKAESVANTWNHEYITQGRIFGIWTDPAENESEVAK